MNRVAENTAIDHHEGNPLDTSFTPNNKPQPPMEAEGEMNQLSLPPLPLAEEVVRPEFGFLWGGLKEKMILSKFEPTEQAEILEKKEILSSLAYFIGKDFEMPVELNQPGQGWHWDFKKNVIRIDPQDLLDKPMDYLRFVIAHEGAHRRITRTEFISEEQWKTPGFGFMTNSIEDPRINNFLALAYPKIREQMDLTYSMNLDIERDSYEHSQQQAGFTPRFVMAGFELIRHWFQERSGKTLQPQFEVPPEVKEVVDKVLADARDSWSYYPSKREADTSEELIDRYAQASFAINATKVWPEFQKLIEMDQEDMKLQQGLQDMMKDGQPSEDQQAGQGQQGGSNQGLPNSGVEIPEELEKDLTEQEKQKLDQAFDQALNGEPEEKEKDEQKGNGSAGKDKDQEGQSDDQEQQGSGGAAAEQEEQESESSGSESGGLNQERDETEQHAGSSSEETEPGKQDDKKPSGMPGIPMDILPDSLKEKLKDFFDRMPDDKKRDLQQAAEQALKDIEDEIKRKTQASHHQADTASQQDKKSEPALADSLGKELEELRKSLQRKEMEDFDPAERQRKLREEFENATDNFEEYLLDVLAQDRGFYFREREEILPVINQVEQKLRAIFKERRKAKYESGKKWGTSINIRHRIGEVAKDITAAETRAWQTRTLPREKDYAITMLVDLSGSMSGEKIRQTFRAAICMAEVLNKLSIKSEILGFTHQIHEYKTYDQDFGEDNREAMSNMPDVTETGVGNSDGWALTQAYERIKRERPEQKFILVFSDGIPAPTGRHKAERFELSNVVEMVRKDKEVKLVGLGVGPGTSHVEYYYPNSVAEIEIDQLAEKLAEVLEDVIDNYDRFVK